MNFKAKISKMGRKLMINVPAKQEGFAPGDNVQVKKIKEVKENADGME